MSAHIPISELAPRSRMSFSWLRLRQDRGGSSALRSLFVGLTVALVAISLRLVLGTEVGRDQIVFSYPAVIVATLLFGMPAGAFAAAACVAVAWYFVVPPAHSFAIQDAAALTTLVVDVFTSAVLVATIGTMRIAVARYQGLTEALESRVRERTAERNRLWERSPELLAVARTEGTLISMNPAFEKLLANDGMRRDLFGLIPVEDLPMLDQAMERLREGAPSAAFESRLNVPAGIAWVAWSVVLDGGQLYLIGRDITAERDCGEQLHQSQKMEAVGQMTGGLAHDFANLLTPVGMSLELIRRRHGEEPRTRALLDTAEEATQRARELAQRLLDFARRKPREPVRIDVVDHLEGLRPLLEQSAADHPLEIAHAEAIPAIVADPNALDSALMNLVVNARDASPFGMPIVISASRTDDAGVRLRVADRGSGMDAATLARVREPFFSTKPRDKGTGLGLAMVQGFMDAIGGELRIDSRVGEGTTVDLEFPPAPPHDAS